jgi:hypothetical protein
VPSVAGMSDSWLAIIQDIKLVAGVCNGEHSRFEIGELPSHMLNFYRQIWEACEILQGCSLDRHQRNRRRRYRAKFWIRRLDVASPVSKGWGSAYLYVSIFAEQGKWVVQEVFEYIVT